MTKEEIKNATEKVLEPPSKRPVTVEFGTSIHLEGNNLEGDEGNEGYRKVQQRERKKGRSRDDNMNCDSAESSKHTNKSAAENRNILGTESQQRARFPRNLQAANKMPTPFQKDRKKERANKLKSAATLY